MGTYTAIMCKIIEHDVVFPFVVFCFSGSQHKKMLTAIENYIGKLLGCSVEGT